MAPKTLDDHTMKIRQADRADDLAIAQVSVAAWRKAYRGIIDDETLDRLDVSNRARRRSSRLNEPEWPWFVAVVDSRVVGFVRIEEARESDTQDKRVGEVGAIYVDPVVWGQGCGRALLSRALDALVDKGFSEVLLWVFEANNPARSFYEKNGFTLDRGRKIHPVLGLTEVRYRKQCVSGEFV